MPKRHIVRMLLGSAMVLFATAAQAQTSQQPKPGPEHKKLEMLTGEWKYEGEAEQSPFGPAGKFAFKETNRMVLDGFFVESRSENVGDSGYVTTGLTLIGYDPASKKYVGYAFESDGSVSVCAYIWDGNTAIGTGTRADRSGKQYNLRSSSTYAADRNTSKSTTEYSADDGKTWKLCWKLTSTKMTN